MVTTFSYPRGDDLSFFLHLLLLLSLLINLRGMVDYTGVYSICEISRELLERSKRPDHMVFYDYRLSVLVCIKTFKDNFPTEARVYIVKM